MKAMADAILARKQAEQQAAQEDVQEEVQEEVQEDVQEDVQQEVRQDSDEDSDTELRIAVDAKLFMAVRQAQSDEELRYYLNGVSVTPHESKGVYLVATNGHILLVAHDPDGWISRPAIIRSRLTDVQLRKESLLTQDCMVEEIGGTFPDWRRVLPKNDNGVAAPVQCYSSAYLEIVTKAYRAVTGQRGRKGGDGPVTFRATAENGPSLVQFPECDRMFGALMPMKQDTTKTKVEPSRLPAWLGSGDGQTGKED